MDDLINSVFNWLLPASMQAGGIVVLLILLKHAFKLSIKPGWRYYLWLFVMLRLLLPDVIPVELPRAFINIQIASFNPQQLFERSALTPEKFSNATKNNSVNNDSNTYALIKENNKFTESSSAPQINYPRVILHCIFIFWLLGVLVCLFRLSKSLLITNRLIQKCSDCTKPAILTTANKVKSSLGIQKQISIKWCHKLSSPASFGVIKPVILLPECAKTLTQKQLSMLLQHEFIHHKRHDLLLNTLMAVLTSLHWFNPFIWIAQREMNTDCELSCDYLVTRTYGHKKLFVYGNLLVQFAAKQTRSNRLAGTHAMSDQIKHISSRILALGLTPHNALLALIKTGISCVIVLIVGFTLPVNASFKAIPVSIDSDLGRSTQRAYRVSNRNRYYNKTISGLLTQPASRSGQSPALVLVHGCQGIQAHHEQWANDLSNAGYVTLRIWRAENEHGYCEKPLSDINTLITAQVMDAFTALEYLSQQDFVDANNISIMSWQSWAAIGAAAKYGVGQVFEKQFKSAIAMYPDCSATYNGEFSIPLQILVGELDDWARPKDCAKIQQVSKLRQNKPIRLALYTNTYHGFDNPKLSTKKYLHNAKNLGYLPARGAIGKYSARAHQDAQKVVKSFLLINSHRSL